MPSPLKKVQAVKSLISNNSSQSIVGLFDQQVTSHPDSPAVHVYGSQETSFRELQALSKCIAARISFIKYGDVVPICMEPSVEFVASILAVLRLGGAYVVLDPKVPIKRNLLIIEDTKASIVLVHERYQSLFPSAVPIEPILTDIKDGRVLPYSRSASTSFDGDGPAYLIYTSGMSYVKQALVFVALTLGRVYGEAQRSSPQPSRSLYWNQGFLDQ